MKALFLALPTQRLRRLVLGALLLTPLAVVGLQANTIFAATGLCSAQPGYTTNYGTVTSTVSISGTGTYRIWTRMSAADTTNNTYMLQIDTSSCFTIGGSTVPTYASGATTLFASGSTNWINKTNTGTLMDVSLSAGSHTLTLIGMGPGLAIDRLVLTQDTACVPTGTGDNCAVPPDTTDPVVSITSPANGASISTTTTVSANATDDVAVAKVEFYVDGALKGTDTTGTPYTYSLSPTGLSVGTHSLYAIAYDTSNNSATSSTVSFTVPDTTAPTISNVVSSSVSQNTATITWTTSEAADSQVKYGTTSSYASTTTLDTTKVTSHSVTLSGLTASTTYHYQVVSKDAAGNAVSSTDATFTTQAPAGDTTKPTVSLTAPASGATVNGTVSVTANASDNVGVVGVQFKLDGANLGSEDLSSPYSSSWVTTGVSNGSHTLTAIARDAAGNTQTATTITVTVSNPVIIPADINQDGHVDYLDLSALSSMYGKSGTAITVPRADINSDGTVNYLDLSALASKYGS